MLKTFEGKCHHCGREDLYKMPSALKETDSYTSDSTTQNNPKGKKMSVTPERYCGCGNRLDAGGRTHCTECVTHAKSDIHVSRGDMVYETAHPDRTAYVKRTVSVEEAREALEELNEVMHPETQAMSLMMADYLVDNEETIRKALEAQAGEVG